MQFRTFAIAMPTRFRGINRREGMLLQGEAGWAEFSPFLGYDDTACMPWLAAAVDSADRPWPEPVRDRIPVNCTVPAVGPELAADIVRRSGCTTAKVKVAERGQVLADDLMRVEAVRDALGPSGRVRVDANGAWSVDDARIAINTLDAVGNLEYVEQPCATVEELAELRLRHRRPDRRRRVDPERRRPACGSPSSRPPTSPCSRCSHSAASTPASRSPRRSACRWWSRARSRRPWGWPPVLALAAALPELPYACGLGTMSLLDGDVVASPLVPVDGHLPVGRVDVDEQAFADVAADDETDARWQARLASVRAARERDSR